MSGCMPRPLNGPEFDRAADDVVDGVEHALIEYFTAAKVGRADVNDTLVIVKACDTILELGKKYHECNRLEQGMK